MDILKKLQEELEIRPSQVENTVKLLDEGNTVPFIARYRKEMTGLSGGCRSGLPHCAIWRKNGNR